AMDGRRAVDAAAKGSRDRLMAETDAEQRHTRSGRRLRQRNRDPRLVGSAGAGRKDDRLRAERQRFGDGDRVAADDAAGKSEFADIAREVVNEAVVIVDE